jgi:ATP-dependent Clp protease ATP-binding subunit ClpA
MFERFTDGARRAVAQAQEEARRLNHGQVGTEHLLLGLVADDGPSGRAFETLNVTLDGARNQVQSEVPPGESASPETQLPFTPRAKGTLDGAPRQAMGLKDEFVDTDHLLLALLIERDSRTASVLSSLGCPPDLLRTTVLHDRKPQPQPSQGLAPALAAAAREVASERGAGAPDAGDLLLALADRSPLLGRALAELDVTPEALRAAVERARRPTAS